MNLLSWLREKSTPDETLQERQERRNKVQSARAKAYTSQMVEVTALSKAAERSRYLGRQAAQLAEEARAVPADHDRFRAAAKAQRRALDAQLAERWLMRPPLTIWSLLKSLMRREMPIKLDPIEPQQTEERMFTPTTKLPRPVDQAIAQRDEWLAEQEKYVTPTYGIVAEAGE